MKCEIRLRYLTRLHMSYFGVRLIIIILVSVLSYLKSFKQFVRSRWISEHDDVKSPIKISTT